MSTLFNQFVYFAFFQCIFLLCIYLFSNKNRKNINGYVAFLVFALLIGLSGRVLYISEVFGKNFRLIAFSEFAALLFGTTTYLFIRSSLQKKRFEYQNLIHYLPSVFYMIFILFYFILPSNETLIERGRTGEVSRTITLFHAIGLLVNIIYWGLGVQEFMQFRERLKNEISYTIKAQFFLNFLIAIGLCLLVWVTLYLISLFGFDMLERNMRPTIWLGLALIVLFIAYYGMISPNVFRISHFEETKKYAHSKLSADDLDRLKLQLEAVMEEKKPYLNQKLLKSELADLIGVNNPEIARLLNERIGMNFFEYVNYYRITEFIKLAESEKAINMTFFGLAQEAGFNSKTTFNKSFKSLMGTTPKAYFNQSSIKNEHHQS